MPDVRYKVTFNFETFAIGASESYLTRATTPDAVTPLIQALITSRNVLLFDVTKWRSIRISQYGVRRRSSPYPPGLYQPFAVNQNMVVPGTGNMTTTPKDKRPDQARACMQIRVGFDGDRTAIRYFAFVPDNILYDEERGLDLNSGPAGWINSYNNFIARLVNDGWSIRALNKSGDFAPKNIADWVTSAAAPNLMGFVLPAIPAPGIAETETVQISNVRRRGTDRTSYNGKYVVQSINDTLMPGKLVYFLRNTEAGDPASIRKMGTVNRIGYTEFGLQRFTPIRPGVHKRGKAQGVPVGRRVNRASL